MNKNLPAREVAVLTTASVRLAHRDHLFLFSTFISIIMNHNYHHHYCHCRRRYIVIVLFLLHLYAIVLMFIVTLTVIFCWYEFLTAHVFPNAHA